MKKIFSIITCLLLTAVSMHAYAQVAGYSMSNAINAGSYSSSNSFFNTANSATGGFTNNYGNAANDVWYKFTISSSASNTVLVSLCGSSFDTYLHVLNSSGTEIASNDDGGPGCSTTLQSSVSLASLAAGTYYVDAEGYGSNSGTVDFSLSVTIIQPPVISYPSGTHTYTTGTAISPLSPTNTGGAVAAVNQVLTFAGTGYAGTTDGSGTSASFDEPLGMAMDGAGNLYVADAGSNLIRKVTPSGAVTTIAGNGSQGYTNGTGTAASFNHPVGLALDASGDLYVADEHNNVIRKITPSGVVTTLAGSGSQGYADGTGTAASFYYPCGVAVDHLGNVYVADTYNQRIRKVTPAGVVTTLAGSGSAGTADGTGTAASFSQPFGLTIDAAGSSLYLTDRTNQRIRRITLTGVVTTFAGSTAGYLDGTGTAAQLQGPTSIAADTAGNLYFTDETNQRVRMITKTGVVSTIAGSGSTGSANGVGTSASFYNPFAIAAAPAGSIYIGDQYNYLVRKIITAPYTISPALPPGLLINPSSGTISGTPTAASLTTNYTVTTIDANTGQGVQAPVSIGIGGGSSLNLSDLNYIATYAPRVAGMNTTSQVYLNSGDNTKVESSVQYMDGLGRPIQTVQVKGSPAGYDVVQPIVYDQYGRDSVKYLPYTNNSSSPGAYHPNAVTGANGTYTASEQYRFYQQPGQGYVNTTAPYSLTGYEPSPLNRVREAGAPGTAWQFTGAGNESSPNHTARTVDTLNDATSTFAATPAANNPGSKIAALYLATVNSNYSETLSRPGNGNYAAGQLTVTVARDENWQPSNGCLGTTEQYKDKEGHMVLRRTYNLSNGKVQMLSTYYVYDNTGNLAFVLPPAARPDSAWVPSSTVLQNLCYLYQYDSHSRMVQKRIPGRGWDFILYNALDQVIGTQDSVQRMKNPQQVSYVKYDGLGRNIITGYYTITSSTTGKNYRDSLQSVSDADTTLWETKSSSGSYTNLAVPTAHATSLVTSYYDDYNASGLPAAYRLTTGVSAVTRGLPTATAVSVLNATADKLWTAHYYDDLGRETRTYKQHYLGGHTEYSANNYDYIYQAYTFTNKVDTVIRRHYNYAHTGTPLVTVSNTYDYDHMDRRRHIGGQLYGSDGTGQNAVYLSLADYNELGQLLYRHLYLQPGMSDYLTSYQFSYNERGWISGITPAGGGSFGENVYYNSPVKTGAVAQYNGNISQFSYNSPNMAVNGGQSSSYVNDVLYTYDNLNRLLKSASNLQKNDERVAYDNMGNIDTLVRTGSNPDAGYLGTLKYNYYTQSTRLHYVYANDGTALRTYSYDGNGNVTRADSGKTVSYNLLNLPMTVKNSGGTTLATYFYDATGSKLRDVSANNGNWDYIDGIVYQNGHILFIRTEEGRATLSASDSITYNYSSEFRDYLGNVRASYDNGGTGGTARLIQENDYFPFGLTTNYYDLSNGNRYLYNGKEKQFDLIDEYDYGARFYDPVVARWMTVDPYAEKTRRFSPYNYALNNPVRNIDLDGDTTYAANTSGQIWNQQWQTFDPSKDNIELPEVTVNENKSGSSDSQSWYANYDDGGLLGDPSGVNNFVGGFVIGEGVGELVGSAIGSAGSWIARTVGDLFAGSTDVVTETTSTITQNAAQGKDFEKVITQALEDQGRTNIAEQVTVKPNGAEGNVRLDNVSTQNGEIKLTDAKSSETAGFTKNQRVGYPAIEQNGGTVVGNNGAAQGYPAGTKIPPTKVEVIRPSDL